MKSRSATQPSEIAFVIPRSDGSITSIRIEFDRFVTRLAGLAAGMVSAAAIHRGRSPQPLPANLMRETISDMLAIAAIGCTLGEDADEDLDEV
jgi:hypothetical protein